MSNIMDDGSVIPSNFVTSELPTAKAFKTHNTSLKVGMVVDIIYPDDKKSLTSEVIEYNIAVSESDSVRGLNITLFRNCKMSDRFGATNNYEVFTLVPGKTDGKGGYEKGSLVLLECIDGVSDSGSACIIGGISNVSKPRHEKADGQFYDFKFNGIRYFINNDGELEIEFNSYTDVDGKQANEKAAGTKIKIDKEGRLKISDNEGQFLEFDRVSQTAKWSNGNESIVIDKKNKKIDMTSSGETDLSSKGQTSIASDDNVSLAAKKDLSTKADANMSMEAKSNMNQKSGGNWEVKATGNVQVKAGGNAIIEGSGIAQLKAALTLLGQGSVPVAAVGISQCIGIGNQGAPVVSQIMTGSATVLVGT